MSRRIAVLVCVVCQSSTALALSLIPISKKSLGDPVANLSACGDWFAARESPVQLPIVGSWCNGAGHYYFAGETADFNLFLERTSRAADSEHVHSRYQQVSRQLVVHPGAGYARSPQPQTDDAGERAQWKLELLPRSHRDPHSSEITRSLTITVHVWIDDKIHLQDLMVPRSFSVASGGEIERFVQDHAPEPAP